MPCSTDQRQQSGFVPRSRRVAQRPASSSWCLPVKGPDWPARLAGAASDNWAIPPTLRVRLRVLETAGVAQNDPLLSGLSRGSFASPALTCRYPRPDRSGRRDGATSRSVAEGRGRVHLAVRRCPENEVAVATAPALASWTAVCYRALVQPRASGSLRRASEVAVGVDDQVGASGEVEVVQRHARGARPGTELVGVGDDVSGVPVQVRSERRGAAGVGRVDGQVAVVTRGVGDGDTGESAIREPGRVSTIRVGVTSG